MKYSIYPYVKNKPVSIPAIAPYLLIRLENIPRKIAGNKDAAASPKANATTSATHPGGSKPRYPAIPIANAAAIRPVKSSFFSDIDGINIPLTISCEIEDEITKSSPAAVDNAAAIPPAATKAITQFGNPAISGFAKTIISRSTFNSFPFHP